jgi:nucleoside-diphosphate kinase
MAIERTLSIIKPDAAAKPGVAGEILSRFEKAGLEIVAMKKMRLSKEMAEGFYAVHKERPFAPLLR